MNTYAKYCPNVFLAKCTERHHRGEIIPVSTRHGKENESIVWNLIYEKDGFFYYSITRVDGFNAQKRAEKKSEKFAQWSESADKKSDEFYKKSNKDKDFLSLMEPIKVGHHSEKRHRKVIDDAHRNMGRSIEFSDKAKNLQSKSEYWASKTEDINLSMPESIEYFEYKLEDAKERHEGLKSGKYERSHSFSLTYAKKAVNEFEDKLKLAKRLWYDGK